MNRLTILVGRPNKSVAPTKYFFKGTQVGRFIPLVGVIRRPVESPLKNRDCPPRTGFGSFNMHVLYIGASLTCRLTCTCVKARFHDPTDVKTEGCRRMEIASLWWPMNDVSFCFVGGTDQIIKHVK